jgi:hypothetical protein
MRFAMAINDPPDSDHGTRLAGQGIDVATNDFDRELAAERFHARIGGK